MRILFKVFPQKSHYNATFLFARALREAGHEVVYAGLAVMQKHVEAQGFSYHLETEDVFPHVENQQNQPKLTFWNMIRNWREIRRSGAIMRQRYGRADAFDRLVRDAKPDLMLVDSPYTFFALSLYKHNIPFGMLESMMPLDRAPDCPPFDTTYVPTGTWLSRVTCTLHWWRFYCKRAVYGFVGVRADANRRFVLEVARRAGVSPTEISFDRYFHIGLNSVPEFFLSSSVLDFPRAFRANQHYINVSQEIVRSEVCGDFNFGKRFAALVEERKGKRPLVYCSMGTAAWRYPGVERFLSRVVQAAVGRNWNLIIAIGTEISRERFQRLPDNVSVFQVVPQLQVLRNADLMITHGGMNSIAECIALCVPMLVYPGTYEIDQAGNAARVLYKRVGMVGRMGKARPSAIAKNIEELLACKTVKGRIRDLRKCHIEGVGPERIFDLCAARLN